MKRLAAIPAVIAILCAAPVFAENEYKAYVIGDISSDRVTGMMAAQAVAEGKERFKRRFIELTSPIAKTVKKDGKLQKLFYSRAFLAKFFDKIRGRSRFTAYFCDRCLSEDIADRGLLSLVREYGKKK